LFISAQGPWPATGGHSYLSRQVVGGPNRKESDLSSKALNLHPQAKKQRAQMLARALRKLGYDVAITVINHAAAQTEGKYKTKFSTGGFSTEWPTIRECGEHG